MIEDGIIEGLLNKPLSQWPGSVFDDLGIKNPSQPGLNVAIVLEALERTVAVDGDVVECGVYRGSSLATIALKIRELGAKKLVWGLDSFKGFPPAGLQDLVSGKLPSHTRPEYFFQTSPAVVEQLLGRLKLSEIVRIVPGYFEDTCPTLPLERISVLVLDCDLYCSYLTCLNALYRRLSPGAYVIFDEYYSKKYPGARVAVDEFFADKVEKPMRADKYLRYSSYERWYTIKL